MKCYLYGLQFSGINIFENIFKKKYNVSFSNINNNNTTSCFHKHFRIYNNKKQIPVGNNNENYFNKYLINSLTDLDISLGDYNNSNRYIVVYNNDILSWLLSIESYAKQSRWITNKKENFIYDYFYYINKWSQLKSDRVIFINYIEYIKHITIPDTLNHINTKILKFINGHKNNILYDNIIVDSVHLTREKNNNAYKFSKKMINMIYSNPLYNQTNCWNNSKKPEIDHDTYRDNYTTTDKVTTANKGINLNTTVDVGIQVDMDMDMGLNLDENKLLDENKPLDGNEPLDEQLDENTINIIIEFVEPNCYDENECKFVYSSVDIKKIYKSYRSVCNAITNAVIKDITIHNTNIKNDDNNNNLTKKTKSNINAILFANKVQQTYAQAQKAYADKILNKKSHD